MCSLLLNFISHPGQSKLVVPFSVQQGLRIWSYKPITLFLRSSLIPSSSSFVSISITINSSLVVPLFFLELFLPCVYFTLCASSLLVSSKSFNLIFSSSTPFNALVSSSLISSRFLSFNLNSSTSLRWSVTRVF